MGKIKVVEIENDVPAPEPDAPVEPVEAPVSQPAETQVEIPKSEEPPITAIAEKPKATKEKKLEYVTCEVCNKSMLAKTYKYSHQKLCKPEAPPPPPPPTPEPKPKRAAKAKAAPKEQLSQRVLESKTEQHIAVYQDPPKPTFTGVVSFNDFPSVVDPYTAMRQQRIIVKQQRVKSLISQAI